MKTPLKERLTGKAKVVSDKSVKDYANDPYFIKKRETAIIGSKNMCRHSIAFKSLYSYMKAPLSNILLVELKDTIIIGRKVKSLV